MIVELSKAVEWLEKRGLYVQAEDPDTYVVWAKSATNGQHEPRTTKYNRRQLIELANTPVYQETQA